MTVIAKGRDPADLKREIEALGPWFHNLHLPGGIQTAPDHFLGDFPSFKWQSFKDLIPSDLSGCRVLDIGCNAGYYSFALAERGAEVIAIDHDPHYLRQAEWARGVLDRRNVKLAQASAYEVDTLDGPFDIILFMGVLYHLRHPLLALDLIACHAPRLLVFQTLTFGDDAVSPHAQEETCFETRHRLAGAGWPHLAFVEETFCGDATNWWVPNHAAVLGMLRSSGFSVIERPEPEVYLCRFGQREKSEELSAAARAGTRGGAGHPGGRVK